MILYLAADLIWASKIKATADAVGVPARPVRTLEMLEARLAEFGVIPGGAEPDQNPIVGGMPVLRALIVDLDKTEEALAMIARVRDPRGPESLRRLRVLAFGPHVAKELLQRAREAGASDVLTRGAFDHHMEEILLQLAGRA